MVIYSSCWRFPVDEIQSFQKIFDVEDLDGWEMFCWIDHCGRFQFLKYEHTEKGSSDQTLEMNSLLLTLHIRAEKIFLLVGNLNRH